jgi:hypothetical protein
MRIRGNVTMWHVLSLVANGHQFLSAWEKALVWSHMHAVMHNDVGREKNMLVRDNTFQEHGIKWASIS